MTSSLVRTRCLVTVSITVKQRGGHIACICVCVCVSYVAYHMGSTHSPSLCQHSLLWEAFSTLHWSQCSRCEGAGHTLIINSLTFVSLQVSGHRLWMGLCTRAPWWRCWTGATALWKCPFSKIWPLWRSVTPSPRRRFMKRYVEDGRGSQSPCSNDNFILWLCGASWIHCWHGNIQNYVTGSLDIDHTCLSLHETGELSRTVQYTLNVKACVNGVIKSIQCFLFCCQFNSLVLSTL